MKVGFLLTTEPWHQRMCGVSAVIRGLVPALETKEITPALMWIQGEGAGTPGAPYQRRKGGWGEYRTLHLDNPALRATLKAWLAEERPDVLHGHWSFAESLALLHNLPDSAPPTLISLHTFESVCPLKTHLTVSGELCDRLPGPGCVTQGCRSPRKFLVHDLPIAALRKRVASRAAGWIVHNAELAEFVSRLGLGPVHCVPLGIEMPRPTPSPEPREPVVLFAGRLRPEKGALWFARLIPELLERNPELTIRIAGVGISQESMQNSIPERWNPRVKFLGGLDSDALNREYARARVTVTPSLWKENFGMVGLEAMSHGCPVVGSDVAGIREWLRHEENGLVFPRGNAAAFVDAVTGVISTPSLAARLGAGALRTAAELSVEAHASAMATLYQATRVVAR